MMVRNLGDGSHAPSPGGYSLVDGSPVPLGSTAPHDPTTLGAGLWARREPMKPYHNETERHRVVRSEEAARLAELVGWPVVGGGPSMACGVVVLRGVLVAVEGVDGSGSTTLSKALVSRLASAGFRACYTREPTDGPVGRLIRGALRGAYGGLAVDQRVMALLFAADRAWHLSQGDVCGHRGVLGALGDGVIVVSDRYKYSSLAYQGPALGVEWVARINSFAPEADVLVYVDTPPNVAEARLRVRKALDAFELDQGLQRAARNAYKAILDTLELSRRGRPLIYRAGQRSLEADVEEIARLVAGLACG